MSDAAAIVALVEADPTLTALIAGRIYPLVLPVAPMLPALTYQLVSQPTEFTQDGARYRWPRWRFRIWAERYLDLVPIANALAVLFDVSPSSPFRSSWIEASVEDREHDTNRYWRLIDVLGFQPGGTTQ